MSSVDSTVVATAAAVVVLKPVDSVLCNATLLAQLGHYGVGHDEKSAWLRFVQIVEKSSGRELFLRHEQSDLSLNIPSNNTQTIFMNATLVSLSSLPVNLLV